MTHLCLSQDCLNDKQRCAIKRLVEFIVGLSADVEGTLEAVASGVCRVLGCTDKIKLLATAESARKWGVVSERITKHKDVQRAIDTAIQAVCCLSEVLTLGGIEVTPEQRRLTLARLVPLVLTHQMETYLKYVSASVFALQLENDVPKAPSGLTIVDPWYIFPAGVRTRLKRRLLSPKRKLREENLRLGYSILMFKRGCAPVSEAFVRSELLKFEQRIGTIDELKPELAPDAEEHLFETIGRFVDALPVVKKKEGLVPSFSAHYDSQRRRGGVLEGGAAGYVARLLQSHPEYVSAALSPWEFHSWGVYRPTSTTYLWPDVMDHLRWEAGDRKPIFSQSPTGTYSAQAWELLKYMAENLVSSPEADKFFVHVTRWLLELMQKHQREFVDAFKELPWPRDMRPSPEVYRCSATALLEPFKVRTITKGPVAAYYLAKHAQKVIHGSMRQHAAFRLIGQTLNDCDVERFAEDNVFLQQDPDRESFKFISADYSAATDNLDPDWSLHVLNQLCVKLDLQEELPVLAKALCSHVVEVRLPKTKEVIEVRQRRGQLMGSPISFPVLCLLNAAICHVAVERAARRLRNDPNVVLPLNQVMVNGDDALLVLDAAGYEDWKILTRSVGLEMSVGKNYSHRDCIVLNSQLYRYDRLGPKGRLSPPLKVFNSVSQSKRSFRQHLPLATHEARRIAYWNMGLVVGQDRVQRTDGQEVNPMGIPIPLSIGAQARKLIEYINCPHERESLISRFIVARRKELDGRPWDLPECLGGLGLPIPYTDGWYKRCIATVYYKNGMKRLESCKLPEFAQCAMRNEERGECFNTLDPRLSRKAPVASVFSYLAAYEPQEDDGLPTGKGKVERALAKAKTLSSPLPSCLVSRIRGCYTGYVPPRDFLNH